MCACSEIDCFVDDGAGDIESLVRFIKVESDLIADAARAVELIDADELEAFAANALAVEQAVQS